MEEWTINGTKLSWLIDLVHETVYIFQPDHEMEQVYGFKSKKLDGKNILPGFEIDPGLLLL